MDKQWDPTLSTALKDLVDYYINIGKNLCDNKTNSAYLVLKNFYDKLNCTPPHMLPSVRIAQDEIMTCVFKSDLYKNLEFELFGKNIDTNEIQKKSKNELINLIITYAELLAGVSMLNINNNNLADFLNKNKNIKLYSKEVSYIEATIMATFYYSFTKFSLH
jgi:hypothetical protein